MGVGVNTHKWYYHDVVTPQLISVGLLGAMSASSTRVGNAIRDARIKAGLSQTELATQIGASQQTVSGYEAGTKRPTVARLRAIERATKTTGKLLRLAAEDGETRLGREVPAALSGKLDQLSPEQLAELLKQVDQMLGKKK